MSAFPTERTLPNPLNVHALWANFWLGICQGGRIKRLLVLGLLFLIPAATALAARFGPKLSPLSEIEFVSILTILPHALVPLIALLYASGMIQDEIEEQTLTYLLMRPTPRWAIYLTKQLAVIVLCTLLVASFTLLAYVVAYVGTTESLAEVLAKRAWKTILLLALSEVAYCCLFGFLSLIVKRSLVVGLIYIIVLESVLANIDFVARKLTVMYYFRVLTQRWLGLERQFETIDLTTAPSASECVFTVLIASLVFASLGAYVFKTREFRVKTPEGS